MKSLPYALMLMAVWVRCIQVALVVDTDFQ